MSEKKFFDNQAGNEILNKMKHHLEMLQNWKKEMFSKDPAISQKARENFQKTFLSAKEFFNQMDDETFKKFEHLQKLFKNPDNFNGEQLREKEEIENEFRLILTVEPPVQIKEKKTYVKSKLKSHQKNWQRS